MEVEVVILRYKVFVYGLHLNTEIGLIRKGQHVKARIGEKIK